MDDANSKYSLIIPDFIEDDVDFLYSELFLYSEKAAARFQADFIEKLEQITLWPLSCAVDGAYPLLAKSEVRKAIINNGRHLILYMVIKQTIVVIMVERAERDYIVTFENNLRLVKTLSPDTCTKSAQN